MQRREKLIGRSIIFHLQFSRYFNTAFYRPCHRAEIRVESMHLFRRFALLWFQLQVIGNMNSFDHQDLSVFFDLPFCFRDQEAFTGRNLARFQRAAKCAGQSAGRRGYHIVQGGRLRCVHIWVDAIMLGNLGMHPEQNRGICLREISPPQWSLDSFYSGMRCINDLVGHNLSFRHRQSLRKWNFLYFKAKSFRHQNTKTQRHL